jgi:hypothetical protein
MALPTSSAGIGGLMAKHVFERSDVRRLVRRSVEPHYRSARGLCGIGIGSSRGAVGRIDGRDWRRRLLIRGGGTAGRHLAISSL